MTGPGFGTAGLPSSLNLLNSRFDRPTRGKPTCHAVYDQLTLLQLDNYGGKARKLRIDFEAFGLTSRIGVSELGKVQETPCKESKMNRGLLIIHSCPMALIRHVEWSVQSILERIHIEWRNQPLDPGTQRTTIEWRGNKDVSAEIASAVKSWHYLRFEVTYLDQYFRHTPSNGLHRAQIDDLGNIQLTEHQVRFAMSKIDQDMRDALDVALGTEWEVELERFRGVDLQEEKHLHAI